MGRQPRIGELRRGVVAVDVIDAARCVLPYPIQDLQVRHTGDERHRHFVIELAKKLPSSASDAFGTPFGELLEAADWKFYDIDPLLFSPADVTLTSSESGRAHHAGGHAPDVLERSFTG